MKTSKKERVLALQDLKNGVSAIDVAKKYNKSKGTIYAWKKSLRGHIGATLKGKKEIIFEVNHSVHSLELQRKVDKAKIILAAMIVGEHDSTWSDALRSEVKAFLKI